MKTKKPEVKEETKKGIPENADIQKDANGCIGVLIGLISLAALIYALTVLL